MTVCDRCVFVFCLVLWFPLGCVHLQGRCLDVADVAIRVGTLWVDALKASPRVDTSCPLATVLLLA